MEPRFEFGKNWQQFLTVVDNERIDDAAKSLCQLLGINNLEGRSFLDAGCGSGLFSLAARRLGASVHSFDVDENSVACAKELKRRYLPNDTEWRIETGSILDDRFVAPLATYAVVYCWGVLHHTGAMWDALDRICELVMPEGHLTISIYNDQGGTSVRWKRIKQFYNRMPRWLRFTVLFPAFIRIWGPTTIRDLLRGRPFATWKSYRQHNRGMSPWRDVVDWVGGYPFEVAKPEAVFDFCRERSMELVRLKTCGGGRGCTEFTFVKRAQASESRSGASLR